MESINLRRYLVEGQGLLVFDDCGMGDPDQAMTAIMRSVMSRVLPEYPVAPVRNNHPLYSAYYELAGPPIGFDIFWYRPTQRRNYLEGISIGDKLAMLLIRRDYMCSMETVTYPSRSASPSPAVYRWATNAVVYSLTTGNIADYQDYVPEDTLAGREALMTAPVSARIADTPLAAVEAPWAR